MSLPLSDIRLAMPAPITEHPLILVQHLISVTNFKGKPTN